MSAFALAPLGKSQTVHPPLLSIMYRGESLEVSDCVLSDRNENAQLYRTNGHKHSYPPFPIQQMRFKWAQFE